MLREANWQSVYPVEGESAVAELMYGGEVIGDLRMEQGQVILTLAVATPDLRKFDVEQFAVAVEEARTWLVENERAREAT